MNEDIHLPSNALPPRSQRADFPVARVMEHELRHLQSEWWWFLVLGILLIISGMVALSYPALSSVAVVLVLGMSLVISGVAMIVATFSAGRWSAHLLQLLIGIFYIVVGFLMMDKPLEATATVAGCGRNVHRHRHHAIGGCSRAPLSAMGLVAAQRCFEHVHRPGDL